jgi:hypothetical protein
MSFSARADATHIGTSAPEWAPTDMGSAVRRFSRPSRLHAAGLGFGAGG